MLDPVAISHGRCTDNCRYPTYNPCFLSQASKSETYNQLKFYPQSNIYWQITGRTLNSCWKQDYKVILQLSTYFSYMYYFRIVFHYGCHHLFQIRMKWFRYTFLYSLFWSIVVEIRNITKHVALLVWCRQLTSDSVIKVFILQAHWTPWICQQLCSKYLVRFLAI
jgi:hypothetical protein